MQGEERNILANLAQREGKSNPAWREGKYGGDGKKGLREFERG
jgi:hypothetical protein